MSLKPEVLDALVAAGASAEMIVAALRADAAEDEARKQARRAGTRERMRRLRAPRVTGPEDGVTGEDSTPVRVKPRHEGVTGRHSPVPPSSPHTPQQPPYPQTTREAHAPDLAQPDLGQPDLESPYLTGVDLDELEREITAAAGKALDPTSVGLHVLSHPLAWLASGADLALDIVPTIRVRASKVKPRSVRTWRYFAQAIADARARRCAGLPPATTSASGSSTFSLHRNGDRNVPTASDLLRDAARKLRGEGAPGPGDGAGGDDARLLSGPG